MGVLQDLENLIVPAEKLELDGVPSASIAILEDGNISAHVITKGNENIDSVYQACSISKAITALAVAKLVDQGRVSYDTKVVDHLSQSTIDCIVEPSNAHLMNEVTVGMLLSHTAGLSQGGFPGYTGELPVAKDVLSGKHPSNTPKMYFLSFPGAQFSYSGGGYTVLQLVLEHVMGVSFPDIMREVVLQPLGMDRSCYGDLPVGEENYTKAHYTGYTQAEAGYHRFCELAAAGLWTTPTDLLKAISAIQNPLYTNAGFLKQETAKTMLTPVTGTPSFGDMGLGWMVSDACFAHAGTNWPGYNAYVFGFHGTSLCAGLDVAGSDGTTKNGIAVMTNSVLGHDVAIKQIVSAIFYLKGWTRFENLPAYFGKDDYVPYAAPQGTEIGEAWRQWIGKWRDEWEIVDQNGPAVVSKSFAPMKMKPAAAPTKKLAEGREELMFVVDGLKTALRLSWQKDEQIIELLQVEAKTLERG